MIEYPLEGVAGAEPFYRLMTTILDPGQAPAAVRVVSSRIRRNKREVKWEVSNYCFRRRGPKNTTPEYSPEGGCPEMSGIVPTPPRQINDLGVFLFFFMHSSSTDIQYASLAGGLGLTLRIQRSFDSNRTGKR